MDVKLAGVLELLLPRLPPRDVVAVACTCAAVARTLRRVSDITVGLEPFPVPLLLHSSSPHHHLFYPFFSYLPCSRLPPPPSPQLPARSCGCDGAQGLCGRTLHGELAYDSNSRLRFLTDDLDEPGQIPSIWECGVTCSCSSTCHFRVTQKGLAVKVQVVKDHLKGWALRAAQHIARGSFVCEYAGELVTTAEAQIRQASYDRIRRGGQKFVSALLVVREHLPSGSACLRINIDATRVGNVARFMNHSCDGGNLQPCIVRLTGLFIPKLAFFASKDILDGEELTFSYGDVDEGLQTQLCFCGTDACKGFLPSEET